jgi:uncharacterized membrane-anchored protein
MVADAVHVVLRVPYAVSTAAFAFALVILFVAWHAVERTLSIHSITNMRRETFYWGAVIMTFALGTAAGDLTATTLGLGYLLSGIFFAALFVLPQLSRSLMGLGEVTGFWASYVLTRPLGASLADWAGVPSGRGGLGLGTGLVTLSLLAIAVSAVATQRFAAASTMQPGGASE